MTQQEQFEVDYINAGTCPSIEDFEKCEDGNYIDTETSFMFEVWLQQAKRHEAEIAELVEALKGMLKVVRDSSGVAGYHPDGGAAFWWEFTEPDHANSVVAKYEVKNK